jgi:predicted GNAT family N-acyltransferase
LIKEYNTLDEDFTGQIKSLIKDEYFKHFYLINSVGQALSGQIQFFDAYTLVDSENESWIIGFWTNGNYSIYGKNWTKKQVKLVIERINDSDFQKGFHFAGTNELISTIFENYKKDTELFKERIFYKIENKSSVNIDNKVKVELAIEDDLLELTKMVCEYFEDEYKGKNNKIFGEMLPSVQSQIMNDKIWVLKEDSELKCFCSLIDTEVGIPIVGSFFTYRNERGKGYGTNLLSKVSNEIVEELGEVWLMSDKHSPESNAVFIKIGYESIYETKDIIINN